MAELDIVPELLELIKKDVEKGLQNAAIARLSKLVSNGTATLKDAQDLAIWTGKEVSFALKRHITTDLLKDDKLQKELAEQLLGEILKYDYDLISTATEAIHNSINTTYGLNIKAIKPKINQDRVNGLIKKISTDAFEKASFILGEPVVTFSQSIVDEAIKANVNFLSKAGLQSMIVRELRGDACDWCKNLAGSYEYPDIPDEVYMRHNRCRCTVVSYWGKTKQDVWSKVITEIK